MAPKSLAKVTASSGSAGKAARAASALAIAPVEQRGRGEGEAGLAAEEELEGNEGGEEVGAGEGPY